MISLTEGLYVSLLTIIETMSVRGSGSRLTYESCPVREKTCSTLDSTVRWHVVWLKTTKCKGNRIRNWHCHKHIISNSFSTPSSTLTKRYHSLSERLDHLRISSMTASNSTDSVTSDSRVLTPRNPPENFYFFRDDSRGVVIFKTSFPSRRYVIYKVSEVICLFGHISLDFYRRGNPMEVIDDCTFFFFGILPHTLRQTDTRSSRPPKKQVVLKCLKLSLSTMTPSLSWVWVPRFLVLKLNSWQTSAKDRDETLS